MILLCARQKYNCGECQKLLLYTDRRMVASGGKSIHRWLSAERACGIICLNGTVPDMYNSRFVRCPNCPMPDMDVALKKRCPRGIMPETNDARKVGGARGVSE
jgi:hypothetical protein